MADSAKKHSNWVGEEVLFPVKSEGVVFPPDKKEVVYYVPFPHGLLEEAGRNQSTLDAQVSSQCGQELVVIQTPLRNLSSLQIALFNLLDVSMPVRFYSKKEGWSKAFIYQGFSGIGSGLRIFLSPDPSEFERVEIKCLGEHSSYFRNFAAGILAKAFENNVIMAMEKKGRLYRDFCVLRGYNLFHAEKTAKPIYNVRGVVSSGQLMDAEREDALRALFIQRGVSGFVYFRTYTNPIFREYKGVEDLIRTLTHSESHSMCYDREAVLTIPPPPLIKLRLDGGEDYCFSIPPVEGVHLVEGRMEDEHYSIEGVYEVDQLREVGAILAEALTIPNLVVGNTDFQKLETRLRGTETNLATELKVQSASLRFR